MIVIEPIESNRLSAEAWMRRGRMFSVGKRKLTHDFEHHWHDFFELEIVLNGKGTQILNGKKYALQPGSVYLLRPTDFHEIKVTDAIELYNLMFHEDCLSDELLHTILAGEDNIIFDADRSQQSELQSLFELMCKEFCMAENYSNHYMTNLLECLLISVQRQISPIPKVSFVINRPIQKAVLYLQLHFKENPTLGEISRAANLSQNYFCEIFHRHTGQTYIEYLTRLKLCYAKKLLASTTLSVTEICFACGFTSLSNFLKHFKANLGISPTAYQKMTSDRLPKD